MRIKIKSIYGLDVNYNISVVFKDTFMPKHKHTVFIHDIEYINEDDLPDDFTDFNLNVNKAYYKSYFNWTGLEKKGIKLYYICG